LAVSCRNPSDPLVCRASRAFQLELEAVAHEAFAVSAPSGLPGRPRTNPDALSVVKEKAL
jgi:hypothetical protein